MRVRALELALLLELAPFLVVRLLAAGFDERLPLVPRLRCEPVFVELLREVLAFFAPDDEDFAPDDERDRLSVLVCAIARPPSRVRFPALLRGWQVEYPRPMPTTPSAPKIACKVEGPTGRAAAS